MLISSVLPQNERNADARRTKAGSEAAEKSSLTPGYPTERVICMTLDSIRVSAGISMYRNTAYQHLGMSKNAQKLGLKEEQTIEKNESRYDLDGTLKEEQLPIGSLERSKKEKEEKAEKLGLDKDDDKKRHLLRKDRQNR
jgi:hypothetical protein